MAVHAGARLESRVVDEWPYMLGPGSSQAEHGGSSKISFCLMNKCLTMLLVITPDLAVHG